MSYDNTYRKFNNVFGSEPEETIINYFDMVDKTKPVLDIGAGQGRNSIFLAEKSFKVDAIDTSVVSVKTLSGIAKKRNLKINCFNKGFNTFIPRHECYSAVLVFGLIQILSLFEIGKLIEKLNQWTCRDALVFITAFGDKDPSVNKYKKEWPLEFYNSFTDGEGNYRTFLRKNEVLSLFPGFEILYHNEGWGKEHHHGDGILEKHFVIEAVLKK